MTFSTMTVIVELKVSHGSPATMERYACYLGQPYGGGRGSQQSALLVFDHGGKAASPGVIDNYIGWLPAATTRSGRAPLPRYSSEFSL